MTALINLQLGRRVHQYVEALLRLPTSVTTTVSPGLRLTLLRPDVGRYQVHLARPVHERAITRLQLAVATQCRLPRVLAAFPEDISSATRARLEAIGITVMTGAQLSAATAEGFELADGSRLAASLKVWAAGVKGPDFLADLGGLEATRNNQLVVRPSLQSTRDPRVYALGDCASLTLAGAERPLPPTAQVAHQQAKHLIRTLPRALRGDAVPDFRYRDMGALVSLGDYDVVGSLGQFGLFNGLTFRGRLTQLSHVMLYRSHQARIHGFWRGGLLWLVDRLNSRVRASIRLD